MFRSLLEPGTVLTWGLAASASITISDLLNKNHIFQNNYKINFLKLENKMLENINPKKLLDNIAPKNFFGLDNKIKNDMSSKISERMLKYPLDKNDTHIYSILDKNNEEIKKLEQKQEIALSCLPHYVINTGNFYFDNVINVGFYTGVGFSLEKFINAFVTKGKTNQAIAVVFFSFIFYVNKIYPTWDDILYYFSESFSDFRKDIKNKIKKFKPIDL